MASHFFTGERTADEALVLFHTPRQNGVVRNTAPHRSPSGFDWGYLGSGPTALAASLCAQVLGGAPPSAPVTDFVKRALIATLEGDQWELTYGTVLDCIARARRSTDEFDPATADYLRVD